MQPPCRANLAWQVLFTCTFTLSAILSPVDAQSADQPTATDSASVEAVIATLEDPAAREKLIADLRLLARTSVTEQRAATMQSSPVARAMQSLSLRLAAFGSDFVALTEGINAVPSMLSRLASDAGNVDTRAVMQRSTIDFVLVIVIAYVTLWIARKLLAPARRTIEERSANGLLGRVLHSLAGLLLESIPIAMFGGAGYLALGLVSPGESARLVALAWIYAGVIVRVLTAVGHAVFTARSGSLRLLPVSDENAAYAEVWLRRLALTGVYGYFGLQAALLLGLPSDGYTALLRLLGLTMAGLLVVLVMQTRTTMTRLIRGRGYSAGSLSSVRERLAKMWHLLAIFYIAVLFMVWALALPGGFIYIARGTVLSAVVLALARLAHRLVAAYFRQGLRVPEELATRFPGIDARANRYLSVVHTGARFAVYLLATMAIMQAWGLDALSWVLSPEGWVLGQVVLRVLAIIVVSALAWEITSTVIATWLAEHTGEDGVKHAPSARTRTLLSVGRNAVLVVIVTVSTLMVLSELGINIGPMLAGAGVLGLAIGFGSQKLVNDVVTGVFILIENLIEVGDVVTVGGQTGVVEAITIRNVRLRDVTGTVHTIPYSSIDTVSNLTREFGYYVLDVGVAYRENTDEVSEVLKTLGEEMQADPVHGPSMLGPLEIFGVQALADSAVIVRARLKTVPGKQWATGREFNRRMKLRFDELGIEIPFPHTTIYFGEDRKGSAPAVHVRLQGDGAVAEPG